MNNQTTNQSDQQTDKPAIWFWVVSVLTLVWNGIGVNVYLQQAYNTEGYQSMNTPEQLEIIANLPTWITGAFAIAVFAGLLGCIALLLRKKWATSLLLLSLVAVIAQMGYLLMKGYADNMGRTIAIIVVALFLVWFSRSAKAKGWLS